MLATMKSSMMGEVSGITSNAQWGFVPATFKLDLAGVDRVPHHLAKALRRQLQSLAAAQADFSCTRDHFLLRELARCEILESLTDERSAFRVMNKARRRPLRRIQVAQRRRERPGVSIAAASRETDALLRTLSLELAAASGRTPEQTGFPPSLERRAEVLSIRDEPGGSSPTDAADALVCGTRIAAHRQRQPHHPVPRAR
jgi:hypothetical protein